MTSENQAEFVKNEGNILHEVAEKGNINELKQLLSLSGTVVDCLDKNGMTPLQHAAYKGNCDGCELLLAHGADVNSNEHDHGYSALMFAALSGNTEVTRLLLEAGARVNHENSVGRNAAQMAAFVGQHQCVAMINNFFSKDDLDYYTVPRGVETESKIPPEISSDLYRFILINNVNPVKLSMYLQDHPNILANAHKVQKLLDLLCEKMVKRKEMNEVMAIKFHYQATIVKHCSEYHKKSSEDGLNTWIKRLLKGRPADGFEEDQEQLIRAMLKSFPYIECNLIQQLVRTVANVTIGEPPTALSTLNQGLNGQRFAADDDPACSTCNERSATKKCSVCKCVFYCDGKCQKLHWFTHKKLCKKMAEARVKHEELVKQQKELQEKNSQNEKEDVENGH